MDELTSTAQGWAAAKAEQAAETKIWTDDNEWLLEQLGATVDDLQFSAMVEKQRAEALSRLPDFRNNMIAIRRIQWLPDASTTTQAAADHRVRAVYGDALLVNDRREGVNGNFLEQQEAAKSILYVLGIAVEDGQGGGIQFSRLVATHHDGPYGKGAVLYSLLSGGKYNSIVARYNQGTDQVLWNNFGATHSPELENLRRGMENAFNRHMTDAAGTPYISASPEYTRNLHGMLYGGLPEGVYATSYKGQLQPLIDVSVQSDRLQLWYELDQFLQNSPLIPSDVQL